MIKNICIYIHAYKQQHAIPGTNTTNKKLKRRTKSSPTSVPRAVILMMIFPRSLPHSLSRETAPRRKKAAEIGANTSNSGVVSQPYVGSIGPHEFASSNDDNAGHKIRLNSVAHNIRNNA